MKPSPIRVGMKQACSLVGLARATHYRRRKPKGPASKRALRMAPPNALSEAERAKMRSVLHAPGALRPGGRPGLGAGLGQRHLSLFASHDAPDPACSWGGTRPPRPTNPSSQKDPRADGAPTQRSLELGHHEAEGSGSSNLLRPLCRPRHLQSLRRQLATRHPRRRQTRKGVPR